MISKFNAIYCEIKFKQNIIYKIHKTYFCILAKDVSSSIVLGTNFRKRLANRLKLICKGNDKEYLFIEENISES